MLDESNDMNMLGDPQNVSSPPDMSLDANKGARLKRAERGVN